MQILLKECAFHFVNCTLLNREQWGILLVIVPSVKLLLAATAGKHEIHSIS